jgi:uncharacterized protein YjbJ (UPF0337 family)
LPDGLRDLCVIECLSVSAHSALPSKEFKEEINMNSDQMEGKWKQLKGAVKEKWGKLTDDDLDAIAGKHDQLVGKIQERYGITKEQAAQQIKEWDATTRNLN